MSAITIILWWVFIGSAFALAFVVGCWRQEVCQATYWTFLIACLVLGPALAVAALLIAAWKYWRWISRAKP